MYHVNAAVAATIDAQSAKKDKGNKYEQKVNINELIGILELCFSIIISGLIVDGFA